MSVLATLDFGTGVWSFNVAPESPSPDLEIGFCHDNGPVTEFESLSFGLAVIANELLVLTKTYPPEGVRYVATDQTYLTNDRVDLWFDDEVVFTVWAENGGERYEGQTTFIVPRPEHPYPSWTWDSESGWWPPVPDPEDGGSYVWDEPSESWVPNPDDEA